MKIVHVISGLGVGGAEAMLFKLLQAVDSEHYSSEVVSLTGLGTIGQQLRDSGIPVHAINMRSGPVVLPALAKLGFLLRRLNPDLVQTWMYHADLIGGVTARLAVRVPVIWGVRHSNLDPAVNKRSILRIAKLCAQMSYWVPKRIVSCSEQAVQVHVELGYDKERMTVIPNGFDLDLFSPDLDARGSVRRELELPEKTPLIGLVGRFDPQKDHRNFIAAAGLLKVSHPEVHFLLCGKGVDSANPLLSAWIGDQRLGDCMHLLGLREDVPRLTSALNIATSSSVGEGFPNVLGEAMACGVPCVATDVGDSAWIVGETGLIVPASDPRQLADAWRRMLEMGPGRCRALGQAARERIQAEFSLPAIARRYEALYEEVAS